MTREEAIQRLKAAIKVDCGYPTQLDDAPIARLHSAAIRALMDADKPMSELVPMDPDEAEAIRIMSRFLFVRDSLAGAKELGEKIREAVLEGIRAGKAM